MYNIFQVIWLGEDASLTTYFNAFNSKMAYTLWDKHPRTLRDSYKMVEDIQNNRKASGKLGWRDDPKLFNPRKNKKEGDKLAIGKNPKEDTMGQVLNLLKNINP